MSCSLPEPELPAAELRRRPPRSRPELPHRDLRDDEWWRGLPAWADVDAATFHDHVWQERNSATSPEELIGHLQGAASDAIQADLVEGFRWAPMSVRVSPYLLSLIDWRNPYQDPIRRQFVPFGSEMEADHPTLVLDSLSEQADAVTPGLIHRYPDRVLLLAVDVCPVYCRYCTRSYAVGLDTATVAKAAITASNGEWDEAVAYIAAHSEVEDVVLSGGDAYRLSAARLTRICESLLAIPHVRRIRVATKGPAVLPQKILTDTAWTDALVRASDLARGRCKQLCVHTHFNHPAEITAITKKAMDHLTTRGVLVRNQSVLLRGVNDDVETMTLLVRRLGYLNVQPYYVYVHDLVRGAEDMRTSLRAACDLEKQVRGATAGFNTPLFVVDTLGGGGKRDVHSFEHYDAITGVSVFTAPSVKPGHRFFYFDPLRELPEEGRARWADPDEHEKILSEAAKAASW